MAAQYIYVMKGLRKVYPGGREILKDCWLSFLPGAKIGVIGTNGAGKSTLLKIMAGLDKDFSGEAWAAQGTHIGYLPQEPVLNPQKTVFENIMEGVAPTQALLHQFEAISFKLCEPLSDTEMNNLLEEQAILQDKIDALNGWELERTLEIAMTALRCPPKNAAIETLSGGEKRRVALCRLLLQHPDMLLLDEPTNHLDAESVAWLERYLKDYKGTVVLITHDRYFLDNVVTWILELDRGEAIPFEGNYSAWLATKEKRLSQETKTEEARQKTLERELEWIRASPKARHAKSKARITAYENLLAHSQEQLQSPSQITIPPGPRLGSVVIEAQNLTKGFENQLLFENLNFKLPPGGIVGIIGPNGAGKTTLFRMISDQEPPSSGNIRVGETVVLGYVDQSRDTLNSQKTVWEEVSEGLDEIPLGKRKVSSRAYCGWFNFRGADQQKKVGQLSGGERNRVHLAKILKSGANLLLLDEPTNDLDVETLRALEDALLEFAGCVVVISHDRWFLDRIATHILAFEGDSQVVWFEGNYADYEEDFRRRSGQDTTTPQRFKYKPLYKGL